MSSRQEHEAHFHDELRDTLQRPGSPEYEKYTTFRKWYSITRGSTGLAERWAQYNCPGKRVLDYGCGGGRESVWLAQSGATVTGIDISSVSVEICKELAKHERVSDKTSFLVADAEAFGFPNNHFDVVWCHGVLHHLDVEKGYREIARVLRPERSAICQEALGHNPLTNYYRRRTPYLRSPDEHPLLRHEVDMARDFFGKVELRFFHLATLAAVPLRKVPGFGLLLTSLEAVDNLILRLPLLHWQAWQVVMLLSQPMSGSRHR